MIGVQFNPNNCAFLASQALNANQFDPSVPDAGNPTTHNLLWDFIANTLIWVDTKTNLIVRELGNGGGIQNEAYSIISAGPFGLNNINQVLGGNYIILPAGTYVFDAEYTYQPDPAGAETATIQIRTNTDTSKTAVDASDVVQAERDTNVPYDSGGGGTVVTQTVKAEPVTFVAPFIVKTALAVGANVASAQNILLSALLIK